MNVLKKIGIAFWALIIIGCLSVDAWYLFVVGFLPEKMTSTTVYLDELKTADGNTESIVEIKYNRNDNGEGLECLDIKFNNYTDSENKIVFSQGLQYVANSKDKKIEWLDYEYFSGLKKSDGLAYFDKYPESITAETVFSQHKFLWTGNYNAYYFNPVLNENATKYNYQSLDNFATLGSTNTIGEKSYFILPVGEELFFMSFKGDNYAYYEDNEIKAGVDRIGYVSNGNMFNANYNYFFNNFTADYFAYQIYNAIQTLPAGTNQKCVLEFGDMFDFYKVDLEGHVGEQIKTEDTVKVINNIRTYFSMHIEISANGVKSANDSIFKVLHGSPNYRLDGYQGTNGEYAFGASIINFDLDDFNLVKVNESDVILKLKEEVLNAYLPYSEKIYIQVTIDTNLLANQGYNYIGLAGDSGIEKFKIYKIEEV